PGPTGDGQLRRRQSPEQLDLISEPVDAATTILVEILIDHVPEDGPWSCRTRFLALPGRRCQLMRLDVEGSGDRRAAGRRRCPNTGLPVGHYGSRLTHRCCQLLLQHPSPDA